MFQHMCDLGEHQSSLAHIALEIAFSQVFSESRMDLCFVCLDGGMEAFQGADTKIEILSCTGIEVLALFFQKLGDLFFFHGIYGPF